MKFSTQYALAGSLIPLASSFPFEALKAAQNDPQIAARGAQLLGEIQNTKRQAVTADSATALFEPIPIFDATAQYIDVSEGSGNEWVAPTGDDLRGPCPGLNAMANHGFLPHNGYATIEQFVEATNTVVGMGEVLATFLGVLGASLDGNLLAWSIGGTPTAAECDTLDLGTCTLGNGISGSHNKYESDASPTRPDLYEFGNDYMTMADQFQQLIDMSPDNNVTLDTLNTFRSSRFDTQIANNPYFFNGPFTGVLVQPAAYTFIYRFMANHSEEYPYGLLTYDVIQSWFGITGESGSYVANQGMERIPDNWYRRAIEYPYSNEYFLADALNMALIYPKFLDIGGNTGTVNTFTGVDVTNLTGGVINAETLTEGNNFACLAYQASTQGKPDIALGVLTQLTDSVSSISTSLGCPQLAAIDESQLEQFPGYTYYDDNI